MEYTRRDVREFLPELFGKEIRNLTMKKSYRNTVEISAYANELAGHLDVELFERHGKPVEERSFKTVEEALEKVIEELNLEEYETAALLCMTQKEADHAAGWLKDRFDSTGFDTKHCFSCMDRNSTKFCKGLTVTTFYHAKGLEFDQVFTLYRGDEDSPLLTQARYICATRALHELYMFSV
jgi:DNA helicase-2/ATP-dependent DNA helicase PcrA